jgi:hypothetical protein
MVNGCTPCIQRMISNGFPHSEVSMLSMKLFPITLWLSLTLLAFPVLAEKQAISSVMPAPPGSSFEDKEETIVCTGTWIGHAFPLNSVKINADKKRNVMVISTAILGTVLLPKPFLAVETEEYEILSWTADALTSKRKQCGTSQRFVEIAIDRKSKIITQIFTGESPIIYSLGDGAKQFQQHFDGVYKPKTQ